MALPPADPGTTCLITGASSGIGAEIARGLAARGLGVTLVARREDRLLELAEELSAVHGIEAEVVTADVSSERSRNRLFNEVEQRGLTVEVLVNNAGFGSGGRFTSLDATKEASMVRTNVEAVVALTGHYLPQMAERGRGAVLNVASLIAFQPVPFQATYGASKAFVLSFTDALHEEMRGTGVTVTAVCPGTGADGVRRAGRLRRRRRAHPGPPVARRREGRPRRDQRAGERRPGHRAGRGQPDRRAVGPAPAALDPAAAGEAGLAGFVARRRRPAEPAGADLRGRAPLEAVALVDGDRRRFS